MNTSKAVKSSVIEAIRMTVFDSLITDNTYIHLMSICKKGNRLFLDGIAFISGVSVKDYSDIDYKLVLEGEKTYILQLAKAYRPEITEVFSKDKDIFTILAGLLLSSMQVSTYPKYLMAIIKYH